MDFALLGIHSITCEELCDTSLKLFSVLRLFSGTSEHKSFGQYLNGTMYKPRALM